MQKFEPWQVQKFRPMQNYVLTTSVLQADVIRIGELELYQDTTYNPGMHQPIVQRVCAVPKTLYFGRHQMFARQESSFDARKQHNRIDTIAINPPIPHSMPWKVPMELKIDDTVYVDSFTLATAEKENRCIDCNGVKYFLVAYSDVYFKLVNGEPDMLNGWLLIEPIDNPEDEKVSALKELGFVFPGITIDNDNRKAMGAGDKLGIIRYAGIPVEKYLEEDTEVHDEVGVGEIIVFKWSANRRLESGVHRFFGQTELIVSRRERIVGVMREDLF